MFSMMHLSDFYFSLFSPILIFVFRGGSISVLINVSSLLHRDKILELISYVGVGWSGLWLDWE